MAVFDKAAQTYDTDFTHSESGRYQRMLVHQLLSSTIAGKTNLKILELNCGTGEDALFLAKKGHKVLATDASTSMIEMASSNRVHPNIEYMIADFRKLTEISKNADFDIIFSNFGGLNCASPTELKQITTDCKQLLKPEGKLVWIFISHFSWSESMYFLLKAEWKKIFRRWDNNGVDCNLGSGIFKVYYYTKSELSEFLKTDFTIVKYRAIGFFSPAGCWEKVIGNNPSLARLCYIFDKKILPIGFLSNFSDHIYLEATR